MADNVTLIMSCERAQLLLDQLDLIIDEGREARREFNDPYLAGHLPPGAADQVLEGFTRAEVELVSIREDIQIQLQRKEESNGERRNQ